MIRVGGLTEMEVKKRKDRVEDAMHATRAATEEGIVAGGGVALLYAVRALDGLAAANHDQRVGIDIMRRALNAAIDGSIVVGKLLDSRSTDDGFDAQAGDYGDMLKAGIIDPTKMMRLALQNAASVAGRLVTTEVVIGDLPELVAKKPPLEGPDMLG